MTHSYKPLVIGGVGILFTYNIYIYAASMIKQSEALYNKIHHCELGREWAKPPQLRNQSGPDPKNAGSVTGHKALR